MDFLILAKKKQTIAIIVVISLIITTLVTLTRDFRYEAKARVLIVQNFPQGIDPFSISRSNEYLTGTLAESVKSGVFYSVVQDSGFNIEKSYFESGQDAGETNKQWRKTVIPKALSDKSIIEISVLHASQYQADQISRAVVYSLKNKHALFHGNADSVEIRELDAPAVSSSVVSPDIPMNYALGALAGLIIALMYIYIFPEERYDIKFTHKAPKQMTTMPVYPQAQHGGPAAAWNQAVYTPYEPPAAAGAAARKRPAPAIPYKNGYDDLDDEYIEPPTAPRPYQPQERWAPPERPAGQRPAGPGDRDLPYDSREKQAPAGAPVSNRYVNDYAQAGFKGDMQNVM